MRIGDLEQLTNFHDKLNPQLWENNRLKPQVRLALFKIAKEFIKFINIDDIKLKDITVSGSNASFNYTPVSDIDLHLIADVNGPCEVNIKEMFLAKKSSFNDQHDISIFGHTVEVYVQNSDEKHISNGIYSVFSDNWLKFPKKITAQPDTSNIEDKFEYLHNEIDQAVDSGDSETIERLKKKIKTMRQSGLEQDGEYGVDNLAFKLLRNEGDIEKLYKAGTAATDTELSLEEGNQFTGELAKARAAGLAEFTVGGKTFKVKNNKKKVNEDDEAEHRDALEKTGFWGKQGAGCIFVAKDSGKFCIAHRSAYVEQPNTWGTWGGAIDSGESPSAAAAREVREEAGWNGQFKLIPMFVFTHPSGFRYSNFLAVVETEFTPQLNWESQGFTWVDYGDWPQPLHPGLASLLNDPLSQQIMKKFATPTTDK